MGSVDMDPGPQLSNAAGKDPDPLICNDGNEE